MLSNIDILNNYYKNKIFKGYLYLSFVSFGSKNFKNEI